MKTKVLILGNLLQKIAIWNTMNQEERLENHIIMLDWVMSSQPATRTIEEIITDKDYELSPEDYINKYNLN